MNGTKIACIILMMFIAGLAYSAQIIQKRATALQEEAMTAEQTYLTAQSAKATSDVRLQRLDASTKELRQFLQLWEPDIARVQSGQDAEQAVNSLLRNSDIFVLSQKFEIKDTKSNPIIPKTLQGTLIVQDEYEKTLNWLGELERRLPLARINSCRMEQGETGRQLRVELTMDIPLINTKALADSKPAK